MYLPNALFETEMIPSNVLLLCCLCAYGHGSLLEDDFKDFIESKPDTIEKGILLGEGKFGRVFVATKNSQKFALKKVPKVDKNIETKVINELKALKAVKTFPAMNKLESVWEDEKNFYILLELIDGMPLHEFIGDVLAGNSLTETQAKYFLAQLGLILDQLESANVVHADLKPENLMIDMEGRIRVIDFGLVKAINQSDILGGTPSYWHPDAIASHLAGKHVVYTSNSDSFAMGVLAFELVDGRRVPEIKILRKQKAFNENFKTSDDMNTFCEANTEPCKVIRTMLDGKKVNLADPWFKDNIAIEDDVIVWKNEHNPIPEIKAAMKFAKGLVDNTLDKKLSDERDMAEKRKLSKQLVDLLADLEDQVHGNIQAKNILIVDGNLSLYSFGVKRRVDEPYREIERSYDLPYFGLKLGKLYATSIDVHASAVVILEILQGKGFNPGDNVNVDKVCTGLGDEIGYILACSVVQEMFMGSQQASDIKDRFDDLWLEM